MVEDLREMQEKQRFSENRIDKLEFNDIPADLKLAISPLHRRSRSSRRIYDKTRLPLTSKYP